MQKNLKWRTFVSSVGTLVAHEVEQSSDDNGFLNVYDVCFLSQVPVKAWINKAGNRLKEEEFLNLYASDPDAARQYFAIDTGEFQTTYIPVQPNVDFEKTRQVLNLNQVILAGTPEDQEGITAHVDAIMGRGKKVAVEEPVKAAEAPVQ